MPLAQLVRRFYHVFGWLIPKKTFGVSFAISYWVSRPGTASALSLPRLTIFNKRLAGSLRNLLWTSPLRLIDLREASRPNREADSGLSYYSTPTAPACAAVPSR